MPYYAVRNGRRPGIYSNWEECQEQISNFQGAWYKKFKTHLEAKRCMNSKDNHRHLSSHLSPQFDVPINYIPEYQMPLERQFELQPQNIEGILAKVHNIRDNVGKCLSNFAKNLEDLRVELDIVENDLNNSRRSEAATLVKQNQSVAVPYATKDSHRKQSQLSKIGVPFPNNWGPRQYDPNMFFNSGMSASLSALNPTNYRPQLAQSHNIPPLIEDIDGFIDVYIDGAVSGKRDSARGGIGVWFSHNHPLNISAPFEGSVSCINAEFQAATKAILQAAAAGIKKLNIHTDSMFMINSITKWMKSWRKNKWQTTCGTPVKIRYELERLNEALKYMEDIKWTHIRSHQGNEGNENADDLAHAGVPYVASNNIPLVESNEMIQS